MANLGKIVRKFSNFYISLFIYYLQGNYKLYLINYKLSNFKLMQTGVSSANRTYNHHVNSLAYCPLDYHVIQLVCHLSV